MDWKYKRSDFRRPSAQLEHVEATIRFHPDRVEAEGVLRLRARTAMKEVVLDCDGAKKTYALDRAYAAGEIFRLYGRGFAGPDRFPEPGDEFYYGDVTYHQRIGKHFLSRRDWNLYMKYIRNNLNR